MNLPEKFEIETFEIWYNKTHGTQIDLIKEVEHIQDQISESFTRKYIEDDRDMSDWKKLMSFIDNSMEIVRASNKELNYSLIPDKQINNNGDFIRFYMKSTKSIINKMWRKCKDVKPEESIKIEEIKDKINDLVRFSIRTNTLKFSQNVAEVFRNIYENPPTHIQSFFKDHISSLNIDEEIKTESGYFAYHIYFKFISGYTVEVQVYSILCDTWRNLSHQIYDTVRDLDKTKYKFNDIKSRVVSIGHLLYLADCELYNLEEENKKK